MELWSKVGQLVFWAISIVFGPITAWNPRAAHEYRVAQSVVEQYARTGLVESDDVRPIFVHYGVLIAGERQTFLRFLADHHYDGAMRFFGLTESDVRPRRVG